MSLFPYSRVRARTLATAILGAAVLVLGGCDDDDDDFIRPGVLSDREIVAVAIAANDGEIQTSQTALVRATDAAVLDFAQQMITSHTALNEQLQGLGISPSENALSRLLVQTAAQTTQTLNQLSGAAFDRAYMDSQIAMHQATLDLLEEDLIPQADNGPLRSVLREMEQEVADHLQLARQIRATLG